MDTEQLKNFLMVAKFKNFTKAAEHLYIGQPALSRQIVDLEQQFGTALFIRNNKKVSLTPAGMILQSEAEKLIEKLDSIEKRMQMANKGKTGTIEVATLGNISPRLSRAANNIFKQIPWISIHVAQMEQEEMRQRLINLEIDAGMTFRFSVQHTKELEYIKVGQEEFCLLIPDGHPLNEEEKITKDMIKDHVAVILKAQQQPAFFDQIFSVSQVLAGHNLEFVKDAQALPLMVDVGAGVGIVPEFVAKNQTGHHISIRKIEDLDTAEDIVVVWNKYNTNPAMEEFIRLHKEVMSSPEDGIEL